MQGWRKQGSGTDSLGSILAVLFTDARPRLFPQWWWGGPKSYHLNGWPHPQIPVQLPRWPSCHAFWVASHTHPNDYLTSLSSPTQSLSCFQRSETYPGQTVILPQCRVCHTPSCFEKIGGNKTLFLKSSVQSLWPHIRHVTLGKGFYFHFTRGNWGKEKLFFCFFSTTFFVFFSSLNCISHYSISLHSYVVFFFVVPMSGSAFFHVSIWRAMGLPLWIIF